MNLLKETLEDIKQSGHSPGDIVFIGSERSGHECTWDEFHALADVEYDSGFGAQEVASDLVIVFSDGASMRRDEYDGSECWVCDKPFNRPQTKLPIKRLTVAGTNRVGWASLEELQTEETSE